MAHLPASVERSQTRLPSLSPIPDLSCLARTTSWVPSLQPPRLNKRRLSHPAWLELSKRTRVASPDPFFWNDHSAWTGLRQEPSSEPLTERGCDGGEDGGSDNQSLCCICDVKHDTANPCPFSPEGLTACSMPYNTQLTPEPVQHRFFIQIEDDVFPMLASADPLKPLTPSQETLIECALENATFIASHPPAASISPLLAEASSRTAESTASQPFPPDPFALGAPSPEADLHAIRRIRCVSTSERSLESSLASALDDMAPRTEACAVRMPIEGYPPPPKRTTRKRKPARAAAPTSDRRPKPSLPPTKPAEQPATFNHANSEWQGVPLSVPADLAFGATYPSLWYETAPASVDFDCSSFLPYPPGFNPYTVTRHDSISYPPEPPVFHIDRHASMSAYYPQATATWGFNHGTAPVDAQIDGYGLNSDAASYAVAVRFVPPLDVWPTMAMPSIGIMP